MTRALCPRAFLCSTLLVYLAASAAWAQNPNLRDMIRDRIPGAGRPTPPVQPAKGPGGADYAHKQVAESRFGEGADECWVFEPGDPAPQSAPVIVFLHGWGGMTPAPYRAWIEHLVKRGNIVIYPRYQLLRTRAADFTPNAVKAVKAALDLLKQPGHVPPDLARFALVGHSAGAVGAANMAAVAAREGLPEPKALMVVQPGRGPDGENPNPRIGIPLEDLSKVPAKCLALVVVGDQDNIAGDAVAKDIFAKLAHIAAADRDYVIVQSDGHGEPALVADHFSPCAGEQRGVDALDWYGTWKLFDGLIGAAFFNRDRHFALGAAEPMRRMGEWSDGRMVRELIVTDDPN